MTNAEQQRPCNLEQTAGRDAIYCHREDMAEREGTIRQLRADFVSEWRQLFPNSPAPPIRALGSLRFDNDDEAGPTPSGVSFDEWLSSGAVTQLGNSLRCTEEKISQLKEQLSRKTYLRNFLLRLLECLDDSGEVQRSRPAPVNDSTYSPSLDPLDPSLFSERGENNEKGVTGEGEQRPNFGRTKSNVVDRNYTPRGDPESGTTKTSEQTTILPRLLTAADLPLTSKSGYGECSGSCQPSTTTRCIVEVTQNTVHGQAPTQRVPLPPPPQQHSQEKVKHTFSDPATSVSVVKFVEQDKGSSSTSSSRPVRQLQRQSEVDEKCTERKFRACNRANSGTDDSDTRNHDTAAPPPPVTLVTRPPPRRERNTNPTQPQRHASSPQRGRDDTAITPNDTEAHLGTGKNFHATAEEKIVRAAESVTCGTQTEISFSLKEQWVISSTDADNTATMFWNRKKSNAKRPESGETRDRDNSGILGRYSDTPADLPTAPPPLRSDSGSARNVQYLKLTDGFNIVLGADTGGSAPKPAPSSQPPQHHHLQQQQQQRHGGQGPHQIRQQDRISDRDEISEEEEEEEEVYDNNTAKRTAAASEGVSGESVSAASNKPQVEPGLDEKYENVSYGDAAAAAGGGGGLEGGGTAANTRRNPVTNVKSTSPSQSPPTKPRSHAPVSRVSSDTTGFRSASAEANSPPKPSAKPQPHPRKKLPALPPTEQKPSSVFYVQTVTPENPSLVTGPNNTAGGGKRGSVGDGELEEGEKGEARVTEEEQEVEERRGDPRVDAGEKGARIESGRGGGSASVSAAPLRHEAHTRQGRDTRADRRAQSALPGAQCLSPHSPPVEGFVPTTSTQPASTTKKGSDDPEPNKATTPATTFHSPAVAIVVASAAASASSFSPASQHRTEPDTRRALSSFHPTAEEKLNSEPTEKTDSAPSRAARDNTDRGDNSSHASQLGVRELCEASVTGALEISQRLRAFADSANDSGSSSSVSGSGGGDSATTTAATATAAAAQAESLSDQPADNNMLRFNRRTLCTTAGSDLGELPAVYRKTEDTPSVFRGSETQRPQSSPLEHTMLPRHEGKAGTKEGGDGEEGGGGGEEATTPTGPQPDSHPTAGVDADADAGGTDGQPRTYHETDLDSEACTLMLRERKPPPPQPPPKPRKKAKESTYENWTINRAVTQFVDSNSSSSDEDDDNDDNDDNDSDSTSPGCTLDRASSTNKGSKDSGLCLDVQPPQASGVVKILVGGAARGLFGGDRFEDERISSIEELHRMHDEEDYADYADLKQQARKDSAAAAEQDDNLSIASDIVFIPGSDVIDSTEDHRQPVSHQDNSSQGNRTLSSTSDDEEEQDSPPSVDSSYDDVDGETSMSGSARDNILKMRYLLVTGVLETEKTYLAILELLIHYKRTLEASCRTSQPVISEEDINSIFSNLQQLQNIHKEFVEGLHNKVNNWSPEQTIGDVFKCLVVMFPEFSKYAENYQRAVATIHRCSQESQRFQELAQQIVLTSTTREVTSLEDALFKPVQRLQRNTLVLHDLIKHTPQDHPDFETLKKALNLSQHNLENFGTSLVPGHKVEEKRNLVKSSFLVELVSGWRKLRFLFLFSDVLVCTKREVHRGGKVMFDCKWFIPMNVLKMDTKFAYQDDMKFSKKDEIDDLKKKLRSLKTELKMELKKEQSKEKHWSISGMASSRTIEKLKKKINELEGQLIMASPKLPFKVWHDTGKVHTMLMTTDYEREEWREVITSLRRKSSRTESVLPSALDVQEMVNSVKELPQVNKIGSVLTETDEEMVYGTLNVTIHKMNGLRSACDTYCCLEMDSYGHFFMKARTHICSNSADPSWNEDFELELEGSQTLRILCYRKGPDKHGDILLGRGALEMSKEWLKGTFQEKTVAMNEFSLVLSVRYTAAEKTMRRTPSKQSTAVFGVKISVCAKREGKTVPTIVTACVQEVERRGMDETGIYRVSGVTSDVQKLKKYFDKNVKAGAMNVSDVDIHSVTGVLKLYLRELPEPLFTEASYSNFMDALKLSDAEGKERCMLSLLHNLPDINYYTAVYLMEHMLKVSRSENDNKMTIHNLSTIFGPTLLAPATKTTGVSLSDMMSVGAEQCMKQSAVIYFFLSLLAKGCSLRRSSTPT